MNSYNNFWNWFQEEAEELHTLIRLDINLDNLWIKLYAQLNEVKPGLGFEMIMNDEDIIELMITAGGEPHNIDLVDELVKAAPSIPGWKFVALQQPIDLDEINVELNGYDFNADTLSFFELAPDNSDKVEIGIVHCLYEEENIDPLITGVLEFLTKYLGERNSLLLIDELVTVGKEYSGNRKSMEKLKSYVLEKQKNRIRPV